MFYSLRLDDGFQYFCYVETHSTRIFSASHPSLHHISHAKITVVGKARTALPRNKQPPLHPRKAHHSPRRVRRTNISHPEQLHGRRTRRIHHVPASPPGIPMAGPQRLPLRVDLLDPHHHLPREHGRRVPNAAHRRQAHRRPPGALVRRGGTAVGARGRVAVRGAPGGRRAGGGIGVDAADDAVRRGRVGRGEGGDVGGELGIRGVGRVRMVVLALRVAVVGRLRTLPCRDERLVFWVDRVGWQLKVRSR
mmetsp:Transcript_33662/g.61872  ORF Transcript_33662/g.61872 Transcript_33662/m.61872 type:complete len:250 (+) Transcript_33662:358-1107(+)